MSAHTLARLSQAFSRRAHQLAAQPRQLGPQLYADLVTEWGTDESAAVLERIERHLHGRHWLRLARQPPIRASRSALLREMDNGSRILAVAWSATGRLATSGADGAIRLWDPDSGTRLETLDSGGAPALMLAWDSNGERLAAGYSDASLRVWEMGTRNVVRFQATEKSRAVHAVAWSPNGRYFAVVNGIKTTRIFDSDFSAVSIWDLDTEDCVAEWQVPGTVDSLAWSPDGQTLAGGGGSVVRIWEVPSGAPVARVSWGGLSVGAIRWSPDGTRLASIGNRAVVKLSDPRTGKTLRELKGHIDSVIAVAWSADGQRLASVGAERVLAIWECERFQRIAATTVEACGTLGWSADGSRLALSLGHRLQLWNVPALALPERRKVALLPVRTVVFSPDGKLLASAGNGGWLRVWSSATGKAEAAREVDRWGIDTIAWAPAGPRRLAAGGLSGLHLWEPQRDELRTLLAWKGGATKLAWSEDGELLVIGFNDTLYIYRVANGAAEQQIALRALVTGFAWRPGRPMLAVGTTASTPAGSTKTVGMSVVATGGGGVVAEFGLPGLAIEWFDWLPGGERLAVCTEDRALHLWSPERPAAAQRVPWPRALRKPLAWSPDGMLMAGGRGPHLTIREVVSGRLLRTIECQDQVAAARFEQDPRRLAVADLGRVSGNQPIPYHFELR